MSTWTKRKLGDVVDFIDGDRGKQYPSQGEFYDSGFCLFLSTKNVPNTKFDFNNKMFITEEKDSQLRKGKLLRGDYVLTTRGTVGNFAYYSEAVPFEHVRINSGMVILRKKSDILENKYFQYVLTSSSFNVQINGRVSGSAQPQLPIRDMVSIQIALPDKESQTHIASVLSAYDDLIENNEKRIKILEEMAERLYREWFVKFKFPDHEKIRLIDSCTEYDKIPERWEVKKLGEIGNAITGKTPSTTKQDFFGEDILFIKTPDIHGNIFIIDSEQKLSIKGSQTQSSKTLPEKTVCVSCIGTLGIVGITTKPSQTNQQINALVLNEPNDYVLFYNFAKNLKQKLQNLGSNGATMGNVNKNKFENILIIYPEASVRKMFSDQVNGAFEKILNLQKANKNLSKTRDLLIPQLVTGKRALREYL